tara:strand:+ start:19 stop:426 length:408 start_codon:yes stop_codon:yes gene_type:complete
MPISYPSQHAILINENITNVSVQEGDELFCSCITSAQDGFQVIGDPFLIGIVTEVSLQPNNVYAVAFNSEYASGSPDLDLSTLCQDSLFISFKKECSVNISSLLGYYAEATFINNDYSNACELFGVNSQVAISSK